MRRLVLTVDGAEFVITKPGSGGDYDWLTGVGAITLAARAGHLSGVGVGESPSAVVEIDNHGKQAAELLGRPLRCPAELYGDDDELLLSGLVARCVYGPTLTLTIEA